jgi:hypothetical protein
MRRTKLLYALGMGLWSAVAVGGQATRVPAALSSALRTHVQNERFEIITSIRGLPLGVRDRLEAMFGGGSLDIADPGAEFQGTRAAVDSKLPLRRLIAAGCSRDHHCLVYYERGGSDRTWHAVLFHWTPNATRVEWGGTAPGGLTTIEEVRKAVLSGGSRGQARFW